MRDKAEYIITMLNGFAFGLTIAGLLFMCGVPGPIFTWSSVFLSIVVIIALKRRSKRLNREFAERMEEFFKDRYGFVREAGSDEWRKIQ